jgi:hypothetical protein
MTTRVDLTLDQGATFEVTIELSDADDQPLDVSLAEAEASMRKHYTSTNSVVFTCELGESELTISLTPEQTAALSPGRYVYDVKLIYTEEEIDRIIEGLITVTPQVTRD